MNGGNRFDNAVGAMRESKWIVAVTVMLPTLILYAIFSERFVRGITVGAIK